MLASSAIQAVVFAALTADSAFMTLIGSRLYDHVPDNKVFPYVTLGESFASPYRTHSRPGEASLFRLHVWSRAKGFKEGQLIAEAIRPLLDGQHFETADFTFAALWEGPSQALRDPDGISRHIVIDFRIFAMEI